MQEILRNDWLTAPASSELIFAPDPEQVWGAALRSVGIDPAVLPSWIPGSDSEDSTN
jgi:putative transcriptional regulator